MGLEASSVYSTLIVGALQRVRPLTDPAVARMEVKCDTCNLPHSTVPPASTQ